MNRLGLELRGFGLSLRDGLRVFVLAPAALLFVMVPEFVQHAAEIHLGMFASKVAFNAHAMDATRWYFGTAKLVGLLFAVLLVARSWSNRGRGSRWWSLGGIAWKPLALGFLIQILCSIPSMLPLGMGTKADMAIGLALTIVSLPSLVLIVAGLLGDHGLGIGEAYRTGWSRALRMALYIGPAWFALQMLHEWDHWTALGQPVPLVWALMAWDALVVGAMAALAGTGLHHGYTGPPGINPKEVSAS